MAAYRRVYDSRHMLAGCQGPRISPGTLRSEIEYGLRYHYLIAFCYHVCDKMKQSVCVCVNLKY